MSGKSACPEGCRTRVWRDNDTKEMFQGCIIEKISRQSFAFLEAFYYYDAKNMFPNPGTWQDQPDKLLQAFNVIGSERGKIEKAEEEKQK